MSELDKYYQILGLNPGASEKEIVEAYKVWLKVWNPDRFSDDLNIQKIAANKINEVDEAFKQLLIGVGNHPEKGKVIQESQSGLRTESPGTGGSVVIQTEPSEAKVYFNEKFVGTSPCKGKHLTVGSYKVRVIKEGYKIWEQHVDIYAGAEKKVFAKLKLIEPESGGQLWKDPYTEMEFIYVKGGWFEMGDTFGDGRSDEQPVHKVFLDDFYIGKYQVTQGQWEKVMGNTPSYFSAEGNNYPVESVSWEDIQDYIRRLKQKTSKSYRLPTEAEWEYAARSGGKKEKWVGMSSESVRGNEISPMNLMGTTDKFLLQKVLAQNSLDILDIYAWFKDNSDNRTHPVGQKKPNGLGLHDMNGNVWEWVQDWYLESYYKVTKDNNPVNLSRGDTKIIRGGSWSNNLNDLRNSNRESMAPYKKSVVVGFRLVFPALHEQTSITKKEQPPAPGEKLYGTESSVLQPESTNLELNNYIFLPPTTVHMDKAPPDNQSMKPPEGGLGVGAKIGITVMVFLIGGLIFGLIRDIVGHGHAIWAGICGFILLYIWSRPSKRANK